MAVNTTTAGSMPRTSSATASRDDLGKLILRLTLGGLILFHGVSKLRGGQGFDFVVQMVNRAGLPSAVAYLVYVGEVIAPILLVIGLFTRVAAVIVAINMLFAFGLVHMQQLFTIAPTGGWSVELQAFYLFTAITLAILGAGRYSVGGVDGRWN